MCIRDSLLPALQFFVPLIFLLRAARFLPCIRDNFRYFLWIKYYDYNSTFDALCHAFTSLFYCHCCRSVSYTHLDVYKRQILILVHALQIQKKFPDSNHQIITSDCCAKKKTSRAHIRLQPCKYSPKQKCTGI